MTALDQFRDNDSAGEHAPTVAIGNAPAVGAILHVRLSKSINAANAVPSGSALLDPETCLTTDLIKASGGDVLESSGKLVVARFPAVQDGVLTARRLQWAAQGFLESRNSKDPPLSVLVQQTEDSLDPAMEASYEKVLGNAPPGQILLTERVGKALNEMGGFALGADSGKGYRELIWRDPEQPSTRSTDELVISWFIEQKGPEFRSEAFAVPDVDQELAKVESATTDGQGRQISAEMLIASDLEPRGSLNRILLIGGAALAALLLIGIFVFHPFAAKSTPAAQATPSAEPTSQPATSQPVPTAVTAPPTTAQPTLRPVETQKHAARQAVAAPQSAIPHEAPKVVDQPAKVVPPPVEKPRQSDSKCELDGSQINGEIEQAETNLARGKYPAAARQFSEVLACDGGNGRARSGLERVHEAQAAAGNSSN